MTHPGATDFVLHVLLALWLGGGIMLFLVLAVGAVVKLQKESVDG
jgi:hypothetical protein